MSRILDSLASSHMRSQNNMNVSSPSKRQISCFNESGSWSNVVERHKFLLRMMFLLAFLCTIYLYFAVTLGASDSCSEFAGAERALCKSTTNLHKGKLKFF